MAKKQDGKAKGKNGCDSNVIPLEAGKRQLEIPGAERPRNKELDKVVEPFVEARMTRIAAQKEEERLHALVLARMKELKLPTYWLGDLFDDDDERYLEIVPEAEKVKIRRPKRVRKQATA